MRFLPIAMMPVSWFGEPLLIMAFIVAILMAFLDRTIHFSWVRLFGLCAFSLFLGAFTGVALAVVLEDVRLLAVGGIAGVIAAVLMGIIGSIQVVVRRCGSHPEPTVAAGEESQSSEADTAQPQTPPVADKPGG